MMTQGILSLGKRTFQRLKSEFFPSDHQLTMRRWRADGGDDELRFSYDLNAESIVLDLGGYKGQWASDIFGRYLCRVYVFEPVTSFAERIEHRFRKNDRIEVFRYGLGASARDEEIRIDADGSSLFGKSPNVEKITIVDVKLWIEEKDIRQIDLIKINIEGGEYELLSRLIDTHLIERLCNIQVQFHPVSPSSLAEMRRIQNKLRDTHRPTYLYEFVWENWARK